MKQNRIKMPQLQFVSIVLLRSGFIPINNLKSGRTFVNTVKIFENLSQNPNEIDVDSFLIHLFYQKSNYFISTRGKRARRRKEFIKLLKYQKISRKKNLKDTPGISEPRIRTWTRIKNTLTRKFGIHVHEILSCVNPKIMF